ncbi:carbohydrate ABC transporter permease [Halorarum halobium]|uniref:carbohydrate ABC transporter permease n=1 Tax=Halorarum halobium TaxID=3075121 RepID=UPI0028A60D08|nr:sugar ABC transporter permease [Halobaculum sp. XH14]
MTIEEKEKFLGYALILPSILLVGIVIIYPLVFNAYLSFTEVPLNPAESPTWVGLSNYDSLLQSSQFWDSFKTTIIFTFFSDLFALLIGLAAGLLLRRQFRGRRFVRGLVLLPFITPVIAVTFTWQWMFEPVYGVFTMLYTTLTGASTAPDILGQSDTAVWVVILYSSWRYYPFAFLMLIARLQAIPGEMYEAAKIDGASRFSQFKDITFPEIKYILGTIFILRWVWNFNTYADVWLVSSEVTTLPIFTYQTAFSTFEQGMASAISMILFVFLMIFVFVYVSVVIEW